MIYYLRYTVPIALLQSESENNMPQISQQLLGFPRIKGTNKSVDEYLLSRGMSLYHRGKVRDTYVSPGLLGKLVVVATDRRVSLILCYR